MLINYHVHDCMLQCFQQLYQFHAVLHLNYYFLLGRASVFMSSVVVFSVFIFGS